MRNVLFNFCVCVAVATWGVSIGGGAQGPLCHSDHYAAQTWVFLIVLGANCAFGGVLMILFRGLISRVHIDALQSFMCVAVGHGSVLA